LIRARVQTDNTATVSNRKRKISYQVTAAATQIENRLAGIYRQGFKHG
jgi:hypothetical protein